MTQPGRSSQAFAYLRSQTPSCHAAEVHSALGLAVDAHVPFAARHPRSRGADVVFDYDQRTSAEDLVPVLQSLSSSASTPHDPHPMAPGEWNGNHNDRAFPMVGVPA